MPDCKNTPSCSKCGSEILVPRYVKKKQVEAFKRGESVDFCTSATPKAVRLIVCDDCKAVVE